MLGAGEFTVNGVEELALPLAVVTSKEPDVAFAGTVVVICVALEIVKTAATPLKESAVAPVKFVPVIVTLVPAEPDCGEKVAMLGAGGVVVELELPMAPHEATLHVIPAKKIRTAMRARKCAKNQWFFKDSTSSQYRRQCFPGAAAGMLAGKAIRPIAR